MKFSALGNVFKRVTGKDKGVFLVQKSLSIRCAACRAWKKAQQHLLEAG